MAYAFLLSRSNFSIVSACIAIIITLMLASMKIKESAMLGTRHMQNVKASMQFAFNTSIMPAPAETKAVDPVHATQMLRYSCNTSETRFDIASGAIHVSQDASFDSIPSNSPYGSWLNMYYPVGKRQQLKQQFQMLDLNRLRIGKVLEVMDTLAIDAGYLYMRDFNLHNQRDKMYLSTIAMAGAHFQTSTSSSRDFGLTVYPIATTESTLTIRADLIQKQE
jgi:hypothetical protein